MALAALCLECQAQPRRTPHANTKYCEACAVALRHRPPANITATQEALIRQLRGSMIRRELAQHVGISQAQLHRYLTAEGLDSNARDYPPDVVTTVCLTYQALGTRETQALFPDVRVRSIVDRHKNYAPRQIRWTAEQQRELVRMAGLVSHTAQARYFHRPNAYGGSIKSFWAKGACCAPRDVNGLGAWTAWQVATPGVPAVLVKHQTNGGARPVVLWLDLAAHLRPDVDPFVREVVQALARCQAALHGTTNPADIRHMIQERELYARDEGRCDERRQYATSRALDHADRAL